MTPFLAAAGAAILLTVAVAVRQHRRADRKVAEIIAEYHAYNAEPFGPPAEPLEPARLEIQRADWATLHTEDIPPCDCRTCELERAALERAEQQEAQAEAWRDTWLSENAVLAISYGCAPELTEDERRWSSKFFEAFDRKMNAHFAALDSIWTGAAA